jgi:cytochrome c1
VIRLSLLLLSAGAALAPGPPAEVFTREAMIAEINPAAVEIWDVSNNALNDAGALDPALMDEAAWGRLQEAAQMLEFYSRRLEQAQRISAGGPDVVTGEVPPGVSTKAEIQAKIDADPEGFRALSGLMAERAKALVDAAKARDAAAAGDLALRLDEPCQSCHQRYWYEEE